MGNENIQSEFIQSAFYSFDSRICEYYRYELINTLNDFVLVGENISKKKLDKLKEHLIPINEKDKECKKRFNGGKKLTHCLRIDFCGLASRTLLNSNHLEGDKYHELTEEIAECFEKLLSHANFVILNNCGIYLDIRFLFAYLYSEFPFSLMKAESERKRHKMDDTQLAYDFENEPGLTKGQFTNSTIFKSQCESINKICALYKSNELLKRTLHNRNLNTMQVRFTPIPIPFCLLKINNNAYSDSYIYAKLKRKNQLTMSTPLVHVNEIENSNHFANTNNHFDYLWHHDLTLILEDCIKEPNDKDVISYENILQPHEVTWNNKKDVIKDYLLHFEKPVPKKEYSHDKQYKWEQIIRNRFLKSTKIPFSTDDDISKYQATVIFTDFVGYSDISNKSDLDELIKNLYDCFNAFDIICRDNNVLKIKTIGDAYMCVAGLPSQISGFPDTKDSQHASIAIKVAKEMMKKFNEIKKIKKINFFEGMTIGINTGLVAVRRFQNEIDIFGPTVNLAARMEQNSKPNQIKFSENTYTELTKAHKLNKNLYKSVKLKLPEFPNKINTYILQGTAVPPVKSKNR